MNVSKLSLLYKLPLVIATVGLTVLSCNIAMAGGGGRGGPGNHGGHIHGNIGVYIGPGFGPAYRPYYPRPYYGPIYYGDPYYYGYPPAVVVTPQQAPAYVEQTPAAAVQQPAQASTAAEENYWYHCDKPDGYYPYVKECPQGWKKVAPQPPK